MEDNCLNRSADVCYARAGYLVILGRGQKRIERVIEAEEDVSPFNCGSNDPAIEIQEVFRVGVPEVVVSDDIHLGRQLSNLYRSLINCGGYPAFVLLREAGGSGCPKIITIGVLRHGR